ncbi:uncharacterized protein DFL_004481 [Arthrobotrys flagrans]|uniref:F-box domain-containing protein n=1 Tax=Arthrobotrys flagrans TaxID=97331 RepID=A0A437A4S1_ARTFL|nr:hypothetical protein DFL_004481 [Arthrobotrys flagrans]
MIYIPEEIKDIITFYLPDQDLKTLRLASREFRNSASRELFGKRNRLILGSGRDKERQFEGVPAFAGSLNSVYLKRKPVEISQLHTYLPSLLPIAEYFDVLEYAPVVWDTDLLGVRIGTHSGEEDGFSYSFPYTARNWREERGYQSGEGEEFDDIDDTDIWVDKPYVIPDRYSTDKERVDAAGVLERRVTIGAWMCTSLNNFNTMGKLMETHTTRIRRIERGAWQNYQTLIPILHATKQRPAEFHLRIAPAYPFIGTNMSSELLNSSIYVMSNLQRLRVSFTRGTKLLSSSGAHTVPGALYKLLNSCKGSLKALSLDLAIFSAPDTGITDLNCILGGNKIKPIIFPKLEELSIRNLIAPAADLERLIESHKSLQCLRLCQVSFYAHAYDWQKLFANIINPSNIHRLYLYNVMSGLGNTTSPEKSRAEEFTEGGFSLSKTWIPDGWKSVPENIYERIASGAALVKENSKFEVFNSKDYPLFVMRRDYDIFVDRQIYDD